jgi:hypothetical protein
MPRTYLGVWPLPPLSSLLHSSQLSYIIPPLPYPHGSTVSRSIDRCRGRARQMKGGGLISARSCSFVLMWAGLRSFTVVGLVCPRLRSCGPASHSFAVVGGGEELTLGRGLSLCSPISFPPSLSPTLSHYLVAPLALVRAHCYS